MAVAAIRGHLEAEAAEAVSMKLLAAPLATSG